MTSFSPLARLSVFACGAIAAAIFPGVVIPESAQAATLNTLTFDEIPTQPVDGLTIEGVTFDFKVEGVDSTSAIYNLTPTVTLPTPIPDPIVIPLNTTPPVLFIGEVPSVLTLDFSTPTDTLIFDVQSIFNFQLGAFPTISVELFDDSTSLGSTIVTLDTVVIGGFPSPIREVVLGETFSYTGAEITSAIISFTGPNPFQLDNLTYQVDSPPVSVPEPTSVLGLLAFGTFGVVARRLKHKPNAC